MPHAVDIRSLNHWAIREVPKEILYIFIIFWFFKVHNRQLSIPPLLLALIFFLGIVVFPSLVVTVIGGGVFVRILLYILMLAIFLGLYILGYNYTRVRNKEAFIDMRVKRNAIRKNVSKINRIKESIKKDKDEDQYGLHEYDEDIEEIEDAINDIVHKKNEVLADFEKTTKNDIC